MSNLDGKEKLNREGNKFVEQVEMRMEEIKNSKTSPFPKDTHLLVRLFAKKKFFWLNYDNSFSALNTFGQMKRISIVGWIILFLLLLIWMRMYKENQVYSIFSS